MFNWIQSTLLTMLCDCLLRYMVFAVLIESSKIVHLTLRVESISNAFVPLQSIRHLWNLFIPKLHMSFILAGLIKRKLKGNWFYVHSRFSIGANKEACHRRNHSVIWKSSFDLIHNIHKSEKPFRAFPAQYWNSSRSI